MSDTQDTLVVELDKRIDAWLASQGRITTLAATSRVPLSQADETQLDDLVAVLDVVAGHGFAGAPPSPSADAEAVALADERLPDLHWDHVDHGTRSGGGSHGAWLGRVAAVAILIVALAVGLIVGLGNRGRNPQPTYSTRGLPTQVINQLVDDADFGGDPYPSQPIQLVETTVGNMSEQLRTEVVSKGVEPSAKIWIGQLVGDFYGQPSTRSGLFHVAIETELVSGARSTAGVLAGNRAYRLSLWGTVHDYQITRPPPQPAMAAMPRQLAIDLNHDASINRDPYPSTPALWVSTTVGRLEHLTGVTPSELPTLKGQSADSSAVLAVQSIGATPGRQSIFEGTLVAGHLYTFEGTSPISSWISAHQLGRLGRVRQDWLGQGVPATVPAALAAYVGTQLSYVYTHPATAPRRVQVHFVALADIALQDALQPQRWPELASLPGNAPIWVVELSVPAGQMDEPGNSYWMLLTGGARSAPKSLSTSFGDSPFWGITSIAQLGSGQTITYASSSPGGAYSPSP